MKQKLFGSACITLLAALAIVIAPAAGAQTGLHSRRLITKTIDDNDLVTRAGNVHPAVQEATDLGKMPDSTPLDHLRLQLLRSPEDEAALRSYLDDLHNPKSANFHKFGTIQQFLSEFGPDPSDLRDIEDWMTSKGLTVNFVTPSMTIDFSGTAGEVSKAFRTELHYLNARGEKHFANVTEPMIPAALAKVVLAPVALHDFKPVMQTKKIVPSVKAEYTVSASYQLVVPGDLATIYNYNPTYSAGISGQGQTVVLLERTDLYAMGDWSTFRKVFGLTKSFPKGKFVTVHPQPSGLAVNVGGVVFGTEACADPGDVAGDDGEATLDVEWASASAPSATVELASCQDSSTSFGAFIALENLELSASGPPAIMSLSYGSPESENGTSGNAYINALYEVAAFEGVSLFVSTGDADADVTDQGHAFATHGINVNALASTPYNVAVGGTDFGDSVMGVNGSYWNTTNGLYYNSAKSYIPEIPWNDSCASQLIAHYLGYATTYGASGFCNSATASSAGLINIAGASSGPSGCASGTPSIPGVVSGTCAGYPKPYWQSWVAGNPADGVRDLPDVSLFAANGIWGHYYSFCYSNPGKNLGGFPCTGAPVNWSGAGGTSFAAPIWAGIEALINQATGSPQGNPSSLYYYLAATEYGTSGSAACNSTLGNGVSPSCIFYDVTLGDNDGVCRPLGGVLHNCYLPSGTYGVLSTSNTSYQPAFDAGTGYDLATGIGTPNVTNLVGGFVAVETGAVY